MDRELIDGVTRTTAAAVLPVAALGWVIAGWPGAAGVLAGALVSLASFRWIARGARRAGMLFAGGRPGALWLLGLGTRHVTLFSAIGLCLWSEVAHPLGLLAGLSLLPPVLILFGLRTAARAA
jgi:ATP synthase I subunit